MQVDTRYSTTATPAAGGGGALGQADFLRLMLAQFQNQNPLEPMENTEFLGQLAQFSMVDGVQRLNGGFADLSERLAGEQTLAAASLLGREVLVVADAFDGDRMSGVVALPVPARRIDVEILDADGTVVRRMTLAADRAGEIPFDWDGRDDGGRVLGEGRYSVRALAVDGEGSYALPTLLSAQVTAVRREGADIALELDGLPAARLSAVRRIT